MRQSDSHGSVQSRRPCLNCRNCPRCDQILKQESRRTLDQSTETAQRPSVASLDPPADTQSPVLDASAPESETAETLETEKTQPLETALLGHNAPSPSDVVDPAPKTGASEGIQTGNVLQNQPKAPNSSSVNEKTKTLTESSSEKENGAKLETSQSQPMKMPGLS